MTGSTGTGSEGTHYTIVVEGELGEDWASWFGAGSVRSENGHTVLQVTVSDQAELHGLLRRVHDLHLRLVSVTRCVEAAPRESARQEVQP